MESWYAIQVGERRNKPRGFRFYQVVARLAPGITLEEAGRQLNSVAADLAASYPTDNAGVSVRVRSLREAETGDIRPYLLMVSAAAGLVLIICCANVAGLLLSRALSLRREVTVRAALGASRGRLIRESLTESLLLALVGGVAGIGVAFAGVRAMMGLLPLTLPSWMRIEVDSPALVFALLASLSTTLLFGIGPALMLSRAQLSRALREHGPTSTGGSMRLRSLLVVAETSLTFLLLVGGALLTRTFLQLRNQETGFRSDGLLVTRVTNYRTGTRAETAAQLSQFHEQVLNRLRALPGVVSAGGTNVLPYTRTSAERMVGTLRVKGLDAKESRLQLPIAGADVSPGFLETMGIEVVNGRGFDGRDTPESPMVVMVSERAAETLWPGRDPIGQELYWGAGEPSEANPYCIVVGVVRNVQHLAGEKSNGLELYYPYTQYPITNIYYVVRAHGDPRALLPSVRTAIGEVDQNAAVVFSKPMDGLIDESLWQRRAWSVLLSAFGALSLLLAATGIYGLLSFLVAQRRKEIGLRVALGARPGAVLGLVIGYGARLLVAGLALGLVGGLALQRLLSGLLVGVSATDPATMLGAGAVLAIVTLAACSIPARRALSADPVAVLRDE
jgi:putative ABC transport system permease protein